MPRRKRPRLISALPETTELLPQGRNLKGETLMSFEEFEAIKLSDYQGLEQAGAAAHMQVSRQTFGRILKLARFKTSQALVEGKRLIITGGCYTMRGRGQQRRRCGNK